MAESNLGKFVDLFNSASKEDKSSLEGFGKALGAAADISGAIGLVGAVIDFVSFVGSVLSNSEDGNDATVRYLQAVQAEAGTIIANEQIDTLLQRLRGLKQTIGEAQSICEGAQGELQANPPISQDLKFQHIDVIAQVAVYVFKLRKAGGGPRG